MGLEDPTQGFGERPIGVRVPSEDAVSAQRSPRKELPLRGSSGLKYVDARTLTAIPNMGEVNVWKPTPKGS